VEIISPSNTVSEIKEKQALYFEAGAREVWTCGMDSKLRFYAAAGCEVNVSRLCPGFPQEIA
jgi:hypothetical protein